MTKVIYNGEEIELHSELEPGYMELDILTDLNDRSQNLEDTMEMKPINLEDTMEVDLDNLSDTQEMELGAVDE